MPAWPSDNGNDQQRQQSMQVFFNERMSDVVVCCRLQWHCLDALVPMVMSVIEIVV
jgi:hypothetical protein